MILFGKAGFVATAIVLSNIFWAEHVSAQHSIPGQPVTQNETAVQADALFFDAVKARIKGDNKQAETLLQQVIKLKPGAAGAYYDLARLSMQEHPDKATTYIKKAIDLNPDNTYYKVQYAEILAFRNQYEAAADMFAKVAEKEQYSDGYLLKASILYQRAGKNKEALKTIDKLIALSGEEEEVMLEKQKLYLKMNDIEGAAGVAKRLIESNPREGRFYILLAEIYASNKQTAKAAEIYKQAESMFPEDPVVQFSLAQYYRMNQDSVKSDEFARKAVSNKALDAETQLELLVGYFRDAGDDSVKRNESLILAADIAKQNAANARVQAVYGDILSIVGKRPEATEQYKKALELEPSSFLTWQNMLFGYTEKQYADSLISNSERALRLFPNQALLHYLNGIGHLNKKSYPSAIKSVNRAIEMQPEEDAKLLSEMYATLGDIYNLTKEYPQSDKSYDQAMKLDPENATVLNNYSYYLSLRGARLSDAEKMSKRSLDIRPGEATFLDTYGWILYKQGKYEKAREYIQKAMDANPASDGTVYEHLGDIYYKLNNTDRAVELWRLAKEKGTENNDIDKKIKDRKLYE